MPSTSNQRVFYRLETALPARHRIVRDGHEIAAGKGLVINLSAGGMLLGADEIDDAVLGELFRREAHFVVDLPIGNDLPPIVTKAQLVWVEGPRSEGERHRYGLKFESLAAADQQRVHEWIVGR